MNFWIIIFCTCYARRGHYNTNDTRSTSHTCQLIWAQGAGAGIKTWTCTSICICFPPKISSVVVVAFRCSGSYLKEQKVLLWIMQPVTNFNLFSLWDQPITCTTPLDKFVEIFGGSKTLSVWVKWMFVHIIPNYHNVQTLVQAIWVCAGLNISSACIRSLLYTWNLCCFHLSAPALHCFTGARRQREHNRSITSQVQLHVCANLSK
jgi:hypothetical protein